MFDQKVVVTLRSIGRVLACRRHSPQSPKAPKYPVADHRRQHRYVLIYHFAVFAELGLATAQIVGKYPVCPQSMEMQDTRYACSYAHPI